LVGLLLSVFSLFDQFFLELYNFLCNGQNYPNHCAIGIKCLHHPLVECIRKIGRTFACASRVWVLVGLLQLLVQLFNQIFTRTI
jgi:hypothetical protein